MSHAEKTGAAGHRSFEVPLGIDREHTEWDGWCRINILINTVRYNMSEKEFCALCRVNRESDVVHICGFCTQMMLEADQEYLKRMYELAKSKNSTDQMWAINCFINKEVPNERTSPREPVERISNREGSDRLARPVKNTNRWAQI